MKVVHLSNWDVLGGAARAAHRLHRALVERGVDSSMRVGVKTTDDWRINGPTSSRARAAQKVSRFVDTLPTRFQRSPNRGSHSPAWVSWLRAREINALEADVINMHWVCGGFLSVKEIGRLDKPLVWTLHDMWAICGAEHYAPDGATARWREGYARANRPEDHRGFDIDRWTWRRKRKRWDRPIELVCPSRWLAGCVRDSALMREWPVTVIPYTIDVETFKPRPRQLARQLLGLPEDVPLVLFGAAGGARDPRKGWHLLEPALATLAGQWPRLEAAVFGQTQPKEEPRLGVPIHWLGHLGDDLTLSLLYSAADVVVVPSLQDNLAQIGVEAQTCGCPVVAFDTAGMSDVLEDGETGRLAEPFDSDGLAEAIGWVLSDGERRERLSAAARVRAERLWAPRMVLSQYLDVYERVIARSHHFTQ